MGCSFLHFEGDKWLDPHQFLHRGCLSIEAYGDGHHPFSLGTSSSQTIIFWCLSCLTHKAMQHPLRSSNIGMRRCCNTDRGRWRCVGWEMLDGACGPLKSSLLAASYASTQAPADLVLVGDEGIWGDSCLVVSCNSCCFWSGSSSFSHFFCILLELDLAWRPYAGLRVLQRYIYICVYINEIWETAWQAIQNPYPTSLSSIFHQYLGRLFRWCNFCWRHGLQPPPAQHITHICIGLINSEVIMLLPHWVSILSFFFFLVFYFFGGGCWCACRLHLDPSCLVFQELMQITYLWIPSCPIWHDFVRGFGLDHPPIMRVHTQYRSFQLSQHFVAWYPDR